MLLIIDNYDSFTWNLAQYLGELGAEVRVVRNDALTVDEALALRPSHFVVSPGPCTPNEAGISLELVRRVAGQAPLLGVCLGHQAIGQAFGGRVVRAARVMHGKTSAMWHDGAGLFAGLPNPFAATRYHSLIVAHEDLPASLAITARAHLVGQERDAAPAEAFEIMGLKHRALPIYGVQFHPESILTGVGKQLLANFLAL